MKRTHYSKQIALSFSGILHDKSFWKQLCWFLRCSTGKDFVQPLVAFISNIS